MRRFSAQLLRSASMKPNPGSTGLRRRLALGFLAASAPLVVAGSLIGGPTAERLFTLLVMGFPVALIAMAIGGRRSSSLVDVSLVALLIVLESGAVAMLLLRGRVFEAAWFGGLPAAAAIQLYGLWLAPLLLVGLVYGLTFDRFELTDDDLERLADHDDREELG
jgi:hypothetical protein